MSVHHFGTEETLLKIVYFQSIAQMAIQFILLGTKQYLKLKETWCHRPTIATIAALPPLQLPLFCFAFTIVCMILFTTEWRLDTVYVQNEELLVLFLLKAHINTDHTSIGNKVLCLYVCANHTLNRIYLEQRSSAIEYITLRHSKHITSCAFSFVVLSIVITRNLQLYLCISVFLYLMSISFPSVGQI
jgi:hypothetical protein